MFSVVDFVGTWKSLKNRYLTPQKWSRKPFLKKTHYIVCRWYRSKRELAFGKTERTRLRRNKLKTSRRLFQEGSTSNEEGKQTSTETREVTTNESAVIADSNLPVGPSGTCKGI